MKDKDIYLGDISKTSAMQESVIEFDADENQYITEDLSRVCIAVMLIDLMNAR